MLLLGDLLRKNALDHMRPNKVAVIFEETHITYRELNNMVNQLSNALISMGVKKGDRLGLLLFNSYYYEIVYFASAKIGAILVPICFWYKGPEICYVVNKSGISTLIIGQEFVDSIEEIKTELKEVKNYLVIGKVSLPGMLQYNEIVPSYSFNEPKVHVDENDPHLILFTSGTTGFPKGAVITHRNYFLHTGMVVQYYDMKENDVPMNVYPMFHMGGPLFMLCSAYIGATLVIVSTPPTNKKILDAIQQHRVTHFTGVPTLWKRLLEYPEFSRYDLSSLKVAMGGSDAMPKNLIEEVLRRTSAASPQHYGLTEGGILTYLNHKDSRTKIGSSGKPHCQAEIKLVNDEGEEVSLGEIGEIICRGEHLMSFYWDMPEETAMAIKDGWLYTGDLGKYDEDGHLYVVGRKKDMIISGGQNIYPAEIEKVLLKHHKIEDCAIIGLPDSEWGESVMALIVLKKNEIMSEEEIVKYVKENMASYNKPRFVKFLDGLPRTAATGKIQKAELRRKFIADVKK